jgi:serine/threonine-protein kinase PknG
MTTRGTGPAAAHGAGSVSTRTGSGRTPSTRSGRSSRSGRTGATRSGRTSSRQITGRALLRPPLPLADPISAIVPPVVPERKRFCSNCDAQLRRDSGFCARCGQEYSFIPSLKTGDVVAQKYEIKGTVAFGGLGWIYLALDTVLNRWVTLKGLLNSKDPRMLEVAVQEREYLAAVKHPNIVGIYDFVTHGEQGFIVLEYVNGKTLMALRKERGGPMPVAEAISYILEVLPAFEYLDDLGLVYCDFKPENVMVEEDTVKLIDMGAVRQIDATGGDIYGSKGYTAPEAHETPTPLSDLYSVARGLAVLVASFDFQGKYETSLPPPSEITVFEEHESLYRFLVKATRHDPAERFQGAGEMAEQLLGVLQNVAAGGSELGRVESAIFETDSDRTSDSERGGQRGDGVPRLKVDRGDPAAAIIIAAGAVADPDRRRKMFEQALSQFPDSMELRLRLIDELVTLERFLDAEKAVADIEQKHPKEWRPAWMRGRALLAQGKTTETVTAFEHVLDELPGELAPKQALGRAYEKAGSIDRAIRYYDAVSRADASFTGAALGLARCLAQKGDKSGAADAYRRVPATSNRFVMAQTGLAELLVSDAIRVPTLQDVTAAAAALKAIEGLSDGLAVHELRARVYAAGASLVAHGAYAGGDLLDVAPRAGDLRIAAERELRACSKFAKTPRERNTFVDRANAVRPLTLF